MFSREVDRNDIHIQMQWSVVLSCFFALSTKYSYCAYPPIAIFKLRINPGWLPSTNTLLIPLFRLYCIIKFHVKPNLYLETKVFDVVKGFVCDFAFLMTRYKDSNAP